MNEILLLGNIYLPCQTRMGGFPGIATQFNRRLELIERAFNLGNATAQDIQEIKLLFLEVVKG